MVCCPRFKLFIGLLVLSASISLLFHGCDTKKTTTTVPTNNTDPKTQTPEGTQTQKTTTPTGGAGSISGVASFSGANIPTMEVIPIQTDAGHCGAELKHENRIVNSANRGLKNVVITIHGVKSSGNAGGITVSNKDCRFDPHVSVAQVGAEFAITNEDPVTHTTHPYSGNRSLFNVPMIAGQKPVKKKLRRSGVIELKCDVHSWMKGWVVVHENAFSAISDADGKFQIKDIPAGSYDARAWHEDLGEVTVQVTIEGGKDAKIDFKFNEGKPVEAIAGGAAVASKKVEQGSDSDSMFEVEAVSPLPGNKPLPLGLDPAKAIVPADNPITAEKVELGKALFFDPRLSIDDTVSCATCHDPKKGYSNGEAVATGIKGLKGGRSAPVVTNRLFSAAQFWDGRSPSVEHQALGPIENPIEMALPLDDAIKKLNAIEGYPELFEKAFGDKAITKDRIGKAIATFERTVVSGNSPFDRHEMGDEKALNESQKRGLALFRGKAKCSVCHTGFNLTDEAYHNIGVGMDAEKPDIGRMAVTKKPEDAGAFKTPTLRDIAESAPFFHDGSAKTLEEVVDFYDKGGIENPTLSKNMFKLNLTDQEKKDLVEIMKAFTGDDRVVSTPPTLPGK